MRAALVGDRFVPGDVAIDAGLVEAIGLPGPGRGVAVPGFVDLQINGFAGVDFRSADPDGYASAAAALPASGVTTFLPTFYSLPVDGYIAALQQLSAVHDDPPPGAHIGAAHLEGPFLSPIWAGAHDRQTLLAPDAVTLHRLLGAGPIAVMTLAPELEGAAVVIDVLVRAGVVVSLGHTDADAATVACAADRGATMFTHLWNAHRRFTPRDPGPAPVALEALAVGLICDGAHLANETVRLTFAAGRRVCVVTDAVAPAGTGSTTWFDGAERVSLDGGAARLTDGTLAGSVTPADAALRWLIGAGIRPEVALVALSEHPAAVLGTSARLEPGAVADVVVLDDRWEVTRTLVGGVEAHCASP